MKHFLFIFLAAGFLFYSVPSQAQPSFKQFLKTLDGKGTYQPAGLSAQLQKLLTRRVHAVQKPISPPAELLFASLENTSAYYAQIRSLPPFPLPQQETELYRGMSLDATGQELRHILKNGLEVSKTHSTNFAAYDGREYPRDQKAIFATPDIRLAASFAYGIRFDKYIPVIIHLKRVSNDFIVSIPHDIPPSWISRVSVLLKIQDRFQWGEIKLDSSDRFVFTPYPPAENFQSLLDK